MGAFVLGAQKLLPVIQKAYASYTRIKGARFSLIDVIELLDQPLPKYANLPSPVPNKFDHSIELNNLSFRYIDNSPWILRNVNLTIDKGTVVELLVKLVVVKALYWILSGAITNRRQVISR